MGNLQICRPQEEYDLLELNSGIVLFGHIHNSQTRVLMNLMELGKIEYTYKPLKMPEVYELT